MRYLLSIFFFFFCLSAFSQVDRIELGYQTSKRGIEWTRPGLPTHVPVFRISRDTNTIIWHDKNTGMRYDWDYLTSVWYARGRFSSSLPPLPTQTSGLATIDNRTGFYLNASNILHRYDITQTAWVPLKITYQSAAPTNVASGGGNGAAIYTTTLWQDSDDFLIRYWDGDSWELIGGGTDLTFSGASSPVTLNSSTGTDVTFTAGTGISLAATGTNTTITNSAPDQTVSITGAGINVVTGAYPNFTVTGTEVDGSVTNELDSKWTDGGAYTYLTSTTDRVAIGSASSPGAKVTITGEGTGYGSALTIEDSGGADGFIVQDNGNVGVGSYFPSGHTVSSGYRALWMDISNSGLIAETTTNYKGLNIVSNVVRGGGGWAQQDATRNSFILSLGYESLNNGATLYRAAAGSGGSFSVLARLGETSNYFTLPVGIANTSPQRTLHVTGEARITDLTTDTPTGVVGADADGDLGLLAFSGMSIVSGTLTAVDGSTTNELQTIANTSNSTSHTATLSNSGGSLQIIEGAGVLLTTGGTGLNGTVTIEAIDPSTTNEIQTLSASGAGPTSYNIDLTSSGTSVTLSEGSGIDLTRSGNTITVASTATSGYVNGGNSFGANATIGLNDAFRWDFETSGLVRGGINSGGTWWVGLTPITTAGFNISGLQNGIGMHVAGGTGLVSPVMLQTRGNGSGSTVLVLDAQHSFLNGNVEALIQNTSTSGSGGVVMQLNAKTATGDPRLYMTIDGTTDWSIGIDNDDVDNLKLHRFAAPSDNNGRGTIEFGYNSTSIGVAINKTGIGTSTNGFYALDVWGKSRFNQMVNQITEPDAVTLGVFTAGNACGTGPSIDNSGGGTAWWGNGGRFKFTAGTSPVANGVLFTLVLNTNYTFADCSTQINSALTTGGADNFQYVTSYNSGTRTITCNLVGTITAGALYNFTMVTTGYNN